MGVQLPSPTLMQKEISQIINLQKQLESSLRQRGQLGQNPNALILAAKEIMRRKIEINDSSIDNTAFNQAGRLLRSIGYIVTETDNLRNQIGQEFKNNFYEAKNYSDEVAATSAYLVEISTLSLDRNEVSNIIETVSNSINNDGKVSLFSFSCPEVDFPYLVRGDYPNDYIQTRANKNTLSQNSQKNRQVFSQLEAVSGYPIELICIVGELDEESYIFPILGDFNTNPYELAQRRDQYRADLYRQITKTYPQIDVQLYGWSQLKPDNSSSNRFLPSYSYIDKEMSIMKMLMQPDKYYAGALRPNPSQLQQICQLKMDTYATQGLVVKSMFPNAIGLQNEFPMRQRSLMLNAGLIAQNQDAIPFTYPYPLDP